MGKDATKKKAFSYSRLHSYRWCKRVYEYKYLYGEPDQSEFGRAILGKAIHVFAERYHNHLKESNQNLDYYEADIIANEIEKTLLLPSMRREFREVIERMKEGLIGFTDIPYSESEYEVKLAVDSSLNPVDFDDDNAVFRGAADILSVSEVDGEIHIVVEDWKTGYVMGKERNEEQLKIYSALAYIKVSSTTDKKISDNMKAFVNHVNLMTFSREEYRFTAQEAMQALTNAIEEAEKIKRETDFKSTPQKACQSCAYSAFCEDYNTDIKHGGMVHNNIRRMNELKSELEFIRRELREYITENGPLNINGAKYGIIDRVSYSYVSDMPAKVSNSTGMPVQELKSLYLKASKASETEMRKACKRSGIDYETIKKYSAVESVSKEMGYLDEK